MKNCCVEKMEEMFDVTNIAWWGKGYLAASPFFLLAPSIFTPGTSSRALVGKAINLSAKMTYSQAFNKVNHNKALPDFVDSVVNFEKVSSGVLADLATGHAMRHSSLSERQILNWWLKLAETYRQVMKGSAAKKFNVAVMR